MFPTHRRSAAASVAPARPSRRPAPRAAATSIAAALVAGTALLAASGGARALDDQWYIGLGGGAALLRPDAVDSGLGTDEEPIAAGTLFVGRDLDERTSVQLQLHALGEAEFEDGRTVSYAGGDASVLYRFFDSRDRAPRGTVFGASLYGRFGLGFLERDTDVALEGDADVNFGAGAGLELYLTPNVALRAEGLFHDRDAGSASVSIVTRFGGRSRALPSPPANVPPANVPPTAPAPSPAPTSAPGADAPPASPGTAVTPAVPPPVPVTSPGPVPTDRSSPDPSTLPETLTLPRDGDGAPGAAPGATPDASSAPLSAPAGVGSASRDAPIDLPTLPSGAGVPLPDAPAPAPAPVPVPAPVPENAPSSPPAPGARGDADGDGDGVVDSADTCPSSSPGYPVRGNGCALLDGVLSGLTFVDGTAELAPGAERQLDYLASLLEEYPTARVELLAHTDDAGTVREQSILTRARLRTVGTYLVGRGVRANRLVLRSFGGTRPLYDNRSAEGRAGNNRIEIIENAS